MLLLKNIMEDFLVNRLASHFLFIFGLFALFETNNWTKFDTKSLVTQAILSIGCLCG